MRLDRLYLRAYGPFTGRELRFARPDTLQIVFGANEAGKSSTLRAITSLLFGIDARSPDRFVHEYGAMRVGAAFSLADGTVRGAMRRKGNKRTLFSIDLASGEEHTDAPLDDEFFVNLLGGLDAGDFRRLFGLDIEDLENGGEALLAGEGDLAKSLFQAAAGLANLQRVTDALGERADTLFRPSATARPINQAIRHYVELEKEARSLAVKTSAWEQADGELKRAAQALEKARGQLASRQAEQRRLERLKACMPLMLQYERLRDELAAIGDVPTLADDASARRVRAQVQLRSATMERGAARDDMAALDATIASAAVDQALLGLAAAIEPLHRSTEDCRAAEARVGPLLAEIEALQGQLTERLAAVDAGLTVADIPGLLPPAPLLARVHALARARAVLDSRRERSDGESAEHAAVRTALDRELAQQPQPAAVGIIEAAHAAAIAEGDLAKRATEIARGISTLEKQLAREVRTFSHLGVAATLAIAVPLDAQIDAFEKRFKAIEVDRAELRANRATIDRDLPIQRAACDKLTAAGAVATQAEVVAARAVRDALWSAVRAAHVERTIQAPDPPLATKYESSVSAADALADTLNADTARATEVAVTRRRIEDMQLGLVGIEAKEREIEARLTEVEIEWTRLIAGLGRPDLDPAGVREWIQKRATLASQDDALETRRLELQQVERAQCELRTRLSAAFVACGMPAVGEDETLNDAIRRAAADVAAARTAHAARETLARRLDEARAQADGIAARRSTLDADVRTWQSAWADAMRALRLKADALPPEATARLDELEGIGKTRNELVAKTRDHEQLRALIDRTRAGVQAALDALPHLSFPGAGVASQAEALNVRLSEERSKRETLIAAHAAREAAGQRAAKAEREIAAGEVDLDTLVRAAGVESVEALPAAEGAALRRRELGELVTSTASLLVKTGERAVESLLAELDHQDPDRLQESLLRVTDEAAAAQSAVEAAQAEWLTARQALARIDGSSAAAEAVQRAQQQAAAISAQVREYARASLAAVVLSRVVQGYRDQHQAPLLRRAGEVFARITLGGFARLVTDYDEEKQVLLGERSSGERVLVRGMSQGTRHQLFLALRLAAIEQQLAGREPVPVIIDDLLVQFDDARAAATLKVLAELATRTQVMFFSHHEHLLALAQQTLGAERFEVQQL